jgi:hypothetical protein
VTATNVTGPWRLPEFYNAYADGTNYVTNIITEGLHAGVQWNLLLPQFLPTANGAAGGPPSRNAFYALRNPAPAP